MTGTVFVYRLVYVRMRGLNMLVLARRRSESVYVGEQVINVVMITASAVFVELIENGESVSIKRLKLGYELQLNKGRVVVSFIGHSVVRFMFDVPEEIEILRSELKEEIQKNSYLNHSKNLVVASELCVNEGVKIDEIEKKVMLLELLSHAAPDSIAKTLNNIARDLLKVA